MSSLDVNIQAKLGLDDLNDVLNFRFHFIPSLLLTLGDLFNTEIVETLRSNDAHSDENVQKNNRFYN